ncbi:MAG: VOC family protein [Fuerstiella sp.]
MTSSFFHGVGGVLSADIAVPDHARELEFYSRILTTGDSPLWRDDLLNNCGTPVIGLGARTPEYSFLPLQWMPHFQVADVATSVANAVDRGGTQLMHSETDDGVSEWAVLTDAMGAAFGVIPVVPDEATEARSTQRLGCLSWLTLAASDAVQSRDFYQQVIGWNFKSDDSPNSGERQGKFLMHADCGTAAAEIIPHQHENQSIPSVWLIHLPVDDLDESLRRVNDCGGEVIENHIEEKCAVIKDPVGVFFVLVECNEGESVGSIAL